MSTRDFTTVIALILIILCAGWLLVTTIGLIFSTLLFVITYPLTSLIILGGLFAAAALIVRFFKS